MARDGFMSYSHSADDKLAPAVQTGLERLAKPWYRRKTLNVFRAETTLPPDPQLWTAITRALDDSRYFIWMASPEAAASPWVNRELQYWLSTKTAADLRILPVLTAGDLVWDDERGDYDPVASTALPPALAHVFAEEPRHIDLRWAHTDEHLTLRNSRFRGAIAELAAPMRGVSKDDLESQDVRRHRRALQLAWSVVIGMAVLTITAVGLLVVALHNASQARSERAAAEVSLRKALSAGLATNATNSNSIDSSQGLLLGVLANRVTMTPDSRS